MLVAKEFFAVHETAVRDYNSTIRTRQRVLIDKELRGIELHPSEVLYLDLLESWDKRDLSKLIGF